MLINWSLKKKTVVEAKLCAILTKKKQFYKKKKDEKYTKDEKSISWERMCINVEDISLEMELNKINAIVD